LDDDSPHFELYQRLHATFAEYTDREINEQFPKFKGHSDSFTFGPELISEELDLSDLLEEPVASEKCTPGWKDRNQLGV